MAAIKDLTYLLNEKRRVNNKKLLRQVGLDKQTLDTKVQQFLEFCRKISLFEYSTGYNSRNVEESDVQVYAPNLSLISALTNGNLHGVKIVEIGTGVAGIACLAYLASQGASVLGIDSGEYPRTVAYELKVLFSQGTWEEMDTNLRKNGFDQADIIYTTNMNPEPWKKSRVTMDFFETQTARAMDESLRSGGIYFGNISGMNDYWYPVGLLMARGFMHSDIRYDGQRVMRIAQKPISKT